MKLKKMFTIMAMLMVVFLAGCNKKDDIPGVRPNVTSTYPITEATSIAVSSQISAIFSVAMDPSTITTTNFTLMQGNTAVAGTIGYTGTTATFTPAANLTYSTLYTAKITTGAENESGLGLANNYTWNFTTGAVPDLIKPTVTLTDPLNSAIGILLNKQISVTFSEAMDVSTITSLTYTLNQGSNSVAGTVTYTGTTGTFTPTNPLENSKEYTATVTTGAKDLAGNSLAAEVVWKFTTLTGTLPVATVNLGTAADFVIFSNTAIANPNANSLIAGNIGVGPGVTSTAITGFSLILPASSAFSTSSQVVGGGNVYASDYAVPSPTYVNTTSNNMLTAYNDAAGRTPSFNELYGGDISGQTLNPGVYKWTNSVVINSDVTIQGSATDIWIFEIAGDLTVATGGTLLSGVKVLLSGGAVASNIFWQVGGLTGATLGTYSTFNGIILSAKQIVMNTGAVLNGKALAQTQVSLNGNAVQP